MSLFSNKKDSLDAELAKAVLAEPAKVEEKLYVAFIELDTEVVRCYGIPESSAANIMYRWNQTGCYLHRGSVPSEFIPSHRILKVTFRPQEEVQREDDQA